MLFLAFSHKITPNCNLRDYKTALFCIITYSLLTHAAFRNVEQVHGIFEGGYHVDFVLVAVAFHDAAQVAVCYLYGTIPKAPTPPITGDRLLIPALMRIEGIKQPVPMIVCRSLLLSVWLWYSHVYRLARLSALALHELPDHRISPHRVAFFAFFSFHLAIAFASRLSIRSRFVVGSVHRPK